MWGSLFGAEIAAAMVPGVVLPAKVTLFYSLPYVTSNFAGKVLTRVDIIGDGLVRLQAR